MYYIPACCVHEIWLSLVLCRIWCAMARWKQVEKCTSKKCGTCSWVSSLHLCNVKVAGQFYGNGALHRSTQSPCAITWPLFLPLLRLCIPTCKKSPQSGVTRMHSLFRLRSSIDRAFRPGVIVWLQAATAALRKTMKHLSGGWERIVRLVLISHTLFLLLEACPATTSD